MQHTRVSLKSRYTFQCCAVPALALLFAAVSPACDWDDSPASLERLDAALKGGVPASDQGKGRASEDPAVAGASGRAEDNPGRGQAKGSDQDAGLDDACAAETEALVKGGKSDAGQGKADDAPGAQNGAGKGKAEDAMTRGKAGKCPDAQAGNGKGKAEQATAGKAHAPVKGKAKAKGAGGASAEDADKGADEASD